MSKIIEFENVYVELPEAYVLEEKTQQEEIVEETINSEIDIKPLEEEVVQEDDLMTAEEIIEEALNDIEEEKEESWNLGYTAGKRDAIEAMRDNFDDMLYNL